MFYFTDTNTGSVISLESKDVKIAWQDGTGTIIYGVKANRVYTSAEAIATIYARNAPQDMIFATDTASGKSIFVPLVAIKDIRPLGSGGVLYYNATQTRQQEINETPIAIVNALAASVAGPTVNAFARHPDALTDLALYRTIRIGLTNGSFFPLDLAPILGSTAKTLFVTKNGSDTLALAAGKYNSHQPWENPTVAMANANGATGDVVVVYPGIYTIGAGGNVADDGLQQMVRDGVTLYMLPGAVIHYTNLTGTASLPFSDGEVASTFIVRGHGKFILNRDVTGGDTFLCTTNANTVVDWEMDELDIRRRLEGTGHDCARWRMVGRKWTQREGQLAALRYPFATSEREVFIKFERTEILEENVNNTWTRFELRNFNSGSKADIDLGEVTFPQGYPGGALFQKTTCSADSVINFKASRAVRTNNDGIRDYLVVGLADFSCGVTDIKNIDTPNGLCLYFGTGGVATSKKTENYQGVIRDGYVGPQIVPCGYSGQATSIKCNLDIVMDSQSVNYQGVVFTNANSTAVSGKLVWHNTTNPPVQISIGSTTCGKLENLILSELDPLIASVINFDPNPKDIRIMNVFATTNVSLANGGVNQLIENIKVDSNV